MARIKRKYISDYIRDMLEEQHKDTSQPKNKLIAKFLLDTCLDDSQPVKLRMEALDMVLDRVEGKPINTNINTEVNANPFDGIDTAKLEALKAKLIEGK